MICGKSCAELGVAAWKCPEIGYLADIEPDCSNSRKPICGKGLSKQLGCNVYPALETGRKAAKI
jgi:hypothetical protein